MRRTLERRFPGFSVAQLTTSVDLEHSFGPIYARGLLRHGQSAFAVLGVNGQETQGSIDAALTFGILWLDTCRHAQAGKLVVEGLKVFLPVGTATLTRERMAHLNREAAKWELYELDERENALKEMDVSDRGNVRTRLVHCADETGARERFADAIGYVRRLEKPRSRYGRRRRSLFVVMGWSLRGVVWRTSLVLFAARRKLCLG